MAEMCALNIMVLLARLAAGVINVRIQTTHIRTLSTRFDGRVNSQTNTLSLMPTHSLLVAKIAARARRKERLVTSDAPHKTAVVNHPYTSSVRARTHCTVGPAVVLLE